MKTWEKEGGGAVSLSVREFKENEEDKEEELYASHQRTVNARDAPCYP